MFVFPNEVFILQLDFWTYPSKPGKPVDIHVPHNRMRQFKHTLKRKSISFRVKIRNLQRVINKARMRPRSVPFNGKFHSYSQVSLHVIVTVMHFCSRIVRSESEIRVWWAAKLTVIVVRMAEHKTRKGRTLGIGIALLSIPLTIYCLRSCHALSVRVCAHFVPFPRLPRKVLVFCIFTHFSQIVHEMKRLAGLNENLARVFRLGKTYENRTMYGIKVSNTVVLSLFLSVLRVLFVEDISKEYTFMNILVSSKLILHSEQQSSLLRKKNAFFWYSILPVHGNDKYFDARKKNGSRGEGRGKLGETRTWE